ncbi:diguanylate cyclase [Jeotgalibacillus sp. R-1-5s-1]|uniref:GGDEF domain-containing protein n=1 Tax=Jeotgalibacillus sp. R-1-5s-1 TaxID=2555897 RepID=UPI00106C14A4|nr:GGDEF domain-containing protein [Jeotgalibacillus sp. R-1-5s-1]TFD99923.1 GGDEF domain-containing protein [Jeotgalibacillus sp. R-1-5s-1]
MVSLDTITLALVISMLALVSAVVMTLTWRMNSDEKGLGFWAWGAIIGGLGFMVMLIMPTIGTYAIVINNVASIAAPLLILEGIMRFRHLGKEKWRMGIMISVILYAITIAFINKDDTTTRYLFHDSLALAIFFLSAYVLMWRTTGIERKIYGLSAVVFTIIGAFFVGRMVLASQGAFNSGVDHVYNTYLFMVIILWIIGWTYGLSLAVNYRAHQRMMKIASHDYLTGLPNRKYLNEYLHSKIDRSLSTKTPFTLFLLDLNGFKQINDTHGHGFGDRVLIMMSDAIQETLGEEDFAARLGGDEFVIVLHGISTSDQIQSAKEKIRMTIERERPVAGRLIELRTSIGHAVFPLNGRGMDEILHQADYSMYKEKMIDRECSVVKEA